MSHSNYKNIYEGYMDNTGYRAHRRESYGGCGSEPTPYMMNENYNEKPTADYHIEEDYNGPYNNND